MSKKEGKSEQLLAIRRRTNDGANRAPNPALKLTPLHVGKIAAILKAGNCPIAFLIYACGAAKRQTVWLLVSPPVLFTTVQKICFTIRRQLARSSANRNVTGTGKSSFRQCARRLKPS
jgi:hypothetical protein